MGTNKPDPKKPNHTLLEVRRSTESPDDYVIILDIPGKHAEYREGAQYKVHPPRRESHLAPLETTCISILRNDPKEKDKVALAFNTDRQQEIQDTTEVYKEYCDEDGIQGLAVEEMPNTTHEQKEKQFITNILNNQKHLHFAHLLNGDKITYAPTGLDAPEFPKSLSQELTHHTLRSTRSWEDQNTGINNQDTRRVQEHQVSARYSTNK